MMDEEIDMSEDWAALRPEPDPATVTTMSDGTMVLHDPRALGMIQAVGKHNCRNLFEQNAERIDHFKQRMVTRRLTEDDVLIVILNVNDPQGAAVADILMPQHDWQAYRDRGEIPVARGLVSRSGIQEMLDTIDPEAGKKLLGTRLGVAVVVMDHEVVEVFDAGPC